MGFFKKLKNKVKGTVKKVGKTFLKKTPQGKIISQVKDMFNPPDEPDEPDPLPTPGTRSEAAQKLISKQAGSGQITYTEKDDTL